MIWRETILELPCVAEGDEFQITLGLDSGEMLTFNSLGTQYILALNPSVSIGEVEVSECLEGDWKAIGRFAFPALKETRRAGLGNLDRSISGFSA